jgi:c-di-GMP-binding flagellar brake protein YcgR
MRIQLRAYVRLETVQFALADEPPTKAVTKDISGGGVLLETRMALERDMPVKMSIDLHDAGIFTAKGEVIRVESDAERNNYTAGIKFVDISERERGKIIKYIFKRQLERRHSGLNT